jgi:hypothetical protein
MPDLAEDFEETLHQLRRLLTRPTVSGLRSIPFLRSTRTELEDIPEPRSKQGFGLLVCHDPAS